MTEITLDDFTTLAEQCSTCTITEENHTKHFKFWGTQEVITHISQTVVCRPYQIVIVEFKGLTSDIQNPSGFVAVDFHVEDGSDIVGTAYKGTVLGESREGYHRYGYIAPKGITKARFRVITTGPISITLSDVKVYTVNETPVRTRNGILYDAHLGMILAAPRNTLTSFEMVKKCGFCSFITNVNATSDGMLVALHNDTIDETSNGTGKVAEYTYEELSAYDFGGWFHEAYQGEKIPKLEDVTKLAAVNGMHLIYRMHRNWADTDHDVYTKQIYMFIKKYGLIRKATLKVFSHTDIDYYYNIFGDDVKYIFCTDKLPTEEQIEWACNFKGDITLEPKHSVITEEFCDKCIAQNVKLSSYIVNDIQIMRKLFMMGVTRFCTDTCSDIVFPVN